MEGKGLIRGFKADGRGDQVCFSHLLFACDTIFSCDADVEWSFIYKCCYSVFKLLKA